MYRTIDAAFWTDPKVRQLPPMGRCLLLYFITNPHTHVSGIYYMPAHTIEHETGIPKRTLDTLCDTLSRLGFCMFDPGREVVWVKNMMRYQGKGEKHRLSAAHHILEDLHDSPLIQHFLDAYPEIKALVPDRVSDRVSGFGPPDSRSLIPDPDSRERIPETKTTSRLSSTSTPDTIAFGEHGFAKMTEVQKQKLVSKMNGACDQFIEEFDLWVAAAPNAKNSGVCRKDRNAYATIQAWYSRRIREGRNPAQSRNAIVNEQDAQREAWDQLAAKVNH